MCGPPTWLWKSGWSGMRTTARSAVVSVNSRFRVRTIGTEAAIISPIDGRVSEDMG